MSISGLVWVSHNRGFDKAVWQRLKETADERECTPMGEGPSAWMCTAALCAYLQLPRNLEGAVEAVFGVRLDKGPRRRSKGVDVRGEGGYVVAPGSRHASGALYVVANDAPLAQCPAWVYS